jgi:hypothetical protein
MPPSAVVRLVVSIESALQGAVRQRFCPDLHHLIEARAGRNNALLTKPPLLPALLIFGDKRRWRLFDQHLWLSVSALLKARVARSIASVDCRRSTQLRSVAKVSGGIDCAA